MPPEILHPRSFVSDAVALIAGAREAIAAASDEFQAWAANALHVTITMDTSSVAPAAAAAAGCCCRAACLTD